MMTIAHLHTVNILLSDTIRKIKIYNVAPTNFIHTKNLFLPFLKADVDKHLEVCMIIALVMPVQCNFPAILES